ncbi:MAG: S8 family serine peptidase, partial [Planctomycetota bacterium]
MKGQFLMTYLGGTFGGRPRFGGLWAGALVVFLLGNTTTAADRYVVKRDGTKVPISRSTTELAVTFGDAANVGASARRLAASGTGVVVEDGSPARSRMKLLRVADVGAPRRSRIAADPDVVEIRPVYRYEGVDAAVVSTGAINVKVRAGLSPAQLEQLWNDYQLEVVKAIQGLRRVYVVKPAVSDHDEVLRAELLADDRRTAWAQPNFRTPHRLRQGTVQDQHYSEQWHLNNSGQSGGRVDADIDALEAWSIAEGEGVLVGMFDDACDVDHEDLRDNDIGFGHDPTVTRDAEGHDDPRPKDSADALFWGNSHGTAVMGLAVASGNSVGVRGVAYKASFTASRGMLAGGIGMSDADQASAFTFAVEQGVDVHNNSWGPAPGVVLPAILLEAVDTAFSEGRDLDGPHGDGVSNRPPRGMVIMFSAGNADQLVEAGDDISTLPTVIGVGASSIRDELVWYSNYGPEIDIIAPGGDSDGFIATTDNDDAAGYIDDGYNIGGFNWDFDALDIDPEGLYTRFFSGTSAASPIAVGVAALVLSVNPLLTATDVRLILEHTADKVSLSDAEYDGITNRSLRYAYGRINARSAVEAAQESLSSGGMTWPERAADVSVEPDQLKWVQNGDPLEFRVEEEGSDVQNDFLPSTDEFLVLESSSAFEFIPADYACYDESQDGCAGEELADLPAGVGVKALGCGLACGTETAECGPGMPQCVEFDASTGTKYFAIYGRSSIGRYSFGVSADSAGNVTDSGRLPLGAPGGGGDGQPSVEGPKVTISVTPLEGISPLTVEFMGNAVSELEIDDSRTEWDFDIDDDDSPTSNQRNTEYTYEVLPGETRVLRARLTMYDVDGNVGTAEVAIRVMGET